MIVIACDKFKGTLTALEACEAIRSGLVAAGVTEEIQLWPMADGGEGTAEILGSERTIESSKIVGFSNFSAATLLIDRSSFALGRALIEQTAQLADGQPLYLGIGGTAIADGGSGLLQALGYRFYDSNGELIAEPMTPRLLSSVSRIELPDSREVTDRIRSRVRLLVDVEASLLPSPESPLSTMDFTRQKGADGAQDAIILTGLQRLKSLFPADCRSQFDGAGGALGFALASVIGCPAEFGAKTLFDRYLAAAVQFPRIVITGEGQLDAQTRGGKVVDYINRWGAARSIPVVTLAGRLSGPAPYPHAFSAVTNSSCCPSPAEAAASLRCLASTLADSLK